MQKLTKIIATIGPSCDSDESIRHLIDAGVNIFRFNFKHSTTDWHAERLDRVNKISESLNKPIGTLIDLQGPEIRLNTPDEKPLEIKKDDLIYIGSSPTSEYPKWFSINHEEILQHLQIGQKIVVDDGLLSFYVEKTGDKCIVKADGDAILGNRKSFNIPGADFPFPVLLDRDREGLELAVKYNIDFVALSFVRSSDDLRIVRDEMNKLKVEAKLIAKIETQKALHDLDNIVKESDGVMVARGDLGVELPKEQVPYYQKIIIKKCIEKGIPVITATQMLQSMIEMPYPTRAEVSDTANATYDLTDAVMLSGETAQGKYPFESVKVMAETVIFNESKFPFDTRNKFNFDIPDTESMICNAAYSLYLQCQARNELLSGIVIFTQTGRTARLLSRYRPIVPIYAFTPKKNYCDGLTMNFGVFPFEQATLENEQVKHDEILTAMHFLQHNGYVKANEKVIVLHGDMWAVEGGTSTIKVITI
jgi:pyruvate kinase